MGRCERWIKRPEFSFVRRIWIIFLHSRLCRFIISPSSARKQEELNAVEKVLYYAPNDEESRLTLVKILRQHNLERRWLM
jgi:hypothetical protein